jgi:hypothetical protein
MLTCSIHLKKNALDYLKTREPVAAKSLINNAVYSIFGENGLISAKNETDFEIRREAYEEKYGNLYAETYLKSLLDKVQNKIVNPSLLEGTLPNDWTNNNCESMNALLKRKLKYTKVKLPVLVEKFSRQYNMQKKKVQGAFQDQGPFKLADKVDKGMFRIRWHIWKKILPSKKIKITSKFFKGDPITKKDRIFSTDGTLSVPLAGKNAGNKPGGRIRKRKGSRPYSRRSRKDDYDGSEDDQDNVTPKQKKARKKADHQKQLKKFNSLGLLDEFMNKRLDVKKSGHVAAQKLSSIKTKSIKIKQEYVSNDDSSKDDKDNVTQKPQNAIEKPDQSKFSSLNLLDNFMKKQPVVSQDVQKSGAVAAQKINSKKVQPIKINEEDDKSHDPDECIQKKTEEPKKKKKLSRKDDDEEDDEDMINDYDSNDEDQDANNTERCKEKESEYPISDGEERKKKQVEYMMEMHWSSSDDFNVKARAKKKKEDALFSEDEDKIDTPQVSKLKARLEASNQVFVKDLAKKLMEQTKKHDKWRADEESEGSEPSSTLQKKGELMFKLFIRINNNV